ncbi:hypothetical protein LJC22_05670, partial [Desulfosarcina sp. OttesenSCG-928-G10]|nr:hypothetical protein [Desulfosarcina sp. OttesenSCG-928-G10]
GSNVQVSGTALNNLFQDVTPTQAVTGVTQYRAFDIINLGTVAGDDDSAVTRIFIEDSTSTETAIFIGMDATTQSVADEFSAPDGVTFSQPSEAAPLYVLDTTDGGRIVAGGRQRVWVKRVVSPGATNYKNDTNQYAVDFA